ncbi:hypothetical protein [Paenibacillus thalictri]|uniref:Uncharacterized protein n=1 Tax=Paenibacillus thalictri TaxID=2527873 RepID=A0A4Q9DG61_9BACL|nr:hypothetical protein [Paenibacillus thalictri]TBL70548.1 hypothetical protein EYB31_33045 [Paenibacillus thalictri]
MSKPAIGKLCGDLSAWYLELPEADQFNAIQIIEEGYADILEWLEEHYPSTYEMYAELQSAIHQMMKEREFNKTQAALKKYKLNEDLRAAMTAAAFDALRPYLEAASLRRMDDAEFERVVDLIILDNYVERRFLTWDRCIVYVQLDDMDQVKHCYLTVMRAVNQHYSKLSTLEELEEYLESELGLSTVQMEMFNQIIIKYREPLDRYMLFRKLDKLEASLKKRKK